MRTDEFEFFLPPELIAERPAERRDESRLYVLRQNEGDEHRRFHDLPSYLNPGDLLILNNSKVFPARLEGQKPSGGRIEILLVKRISDLCWEILTRERYTGEVMISDDLSAEVSDGRIARFSAKRDFMEIVWEVGLMPLPPYIRRRADTKDKVRYQTVYAETQGSIAAPTAGLHFTADLLDRIRARSVSIRTLTLHVGVGTFRPVRVEKVEDHRMDEEFFEIDAALPSEIAAVKQRGGRIVTVGTTTTRAIEGVMSGRCEISARNSSIRGSTDIFIHGGYRFRAVDALITNFHLPRSTPLMLAAALAGRERLLESYRVAIGLGYRFFSYGDAMLVI